MLTDVNTLKKILQATPVNIPNVFNERIKLDLYEKSQLEHNNIDTDSETIKIIRQTEPSVDPNSPITLNDQDSFQLSNTKIVWDTVLVASTLGLATIYTENVDYIINYNMGTIERTTAGSSIPNHGSVYVWYLPYTILTAGNDYNIDYPEGTINRRAGTSIPNAATIYVDYSHAQNTITDDAIKEIIKEMEYVIEPKLKSQYSLKSDDEGLKASATNYCLYLLCLSHAVRELRAAEKANSDDVAKQWQVLADKYFDAANFMFSKYLKVETKPIGGIINNRLVKNKKRTISNPTVNVKIRNH